MANSLSSSDASNVLPNVDRAFIQYPLEFNAPFAIKVIHYGKGYLSVINVRVRAWHAKEIPKNVYHANQDIISQIKHAPSVSIDAKNALVNPFVLCASLIFQNLLS